MRHLNCDEGEESLPYIWPKGESNTKDAQGNAQRKNAPCWNLAVVAVISSPWSGHVVMSMLVWCCGRCCVVVGGGDRGVFRMRSEGFSFNSGGLEVGVGFAQCCFGVRNRSQPR